MGFFSKLFGKKEEKPKQEPVKPKEEEKIMGQKLTNQDIEAIALEFGLDKAHVMAIFTVEAGGKSGFLKENPFIPVTLEEGHIFYKYAKQHGKDVADICKRYPTICYPKWTKAYYKTGLAEYNRYLLAKEIDEEAANLATSWGMGQVMGFNYEAAGYSDLSSFIQAMYESEKCQLLAVCRFIKSNTKMYKALKEEDWATFAKLYNGPGYAANKYDEKLKKAYEKYKKPV